MKMHQASIQSNNYSMQLTEAVNIAQDKIDSLRGITFDDPEMTVAVHNTQLINDAALGAIATRGIEYRLSYEVTITPNTNNSGRSVNLSVTWWEKNIHHILNIPVVLCQY